MDELLSRAGSQVVSFAIKSSVSVASTYAIKQFTKFLTHVPQRDASRLQKLRKQLETRIDIIDNAIGLIKLCVVRGNTNLGSTLSLVLDLKDELLQFNLEMDEILAPSNLGDAKSNKKDSHDQAAVSLLEAKMKELIHRIELVIPLINLSMTTSGVSTSMKLPNNVSASLLLQASNHIVKSNEKAILTGNKIDIQVGPKFEVTAYNIFNNSSTIIWKERMARCDLRVYRSAISEANPIQYDYYIEFKENFDDGRYHDLKEDKPVKLRWQLAKVIRLFFTASGKLLNLEERDSPVLVLKIDKNLEREHITSTENIEWIALGEYEDIVETSDNESTEEATEAQEREEGSSSEEENYDSAEEEEVNPETSKSLSLLEYIIKLASLQDNDQASILEVKDERLSLYLNDENPNSVRSQRYDVNAVTEKLNDTSLNK
ncbi:HFL048Cp [Eremothecium sinecaudum]|uniref:HFL048Cp n=1 Tax=Eremothecium sinecaudum TaxID=45286 RepID=A0A109UZS3_9SACH|nr:HFL048Cp [Eremothecium sinecaudum]AMD21808.1 HFL048Cp [Eremothecium sinecaudum]